MREERYIYMYIHTYITWHRIFVLFADKSRRGCRTPGRCGKKRKTRTKRKKNEDQKDLGERDVGGGGGYLDGDLIGNGRFIVSSKTSSNYDPAGWMPTALVFQPFVPTESGERAFLLWVSASIGQMENSEESGIRFVVGL
jgi:hypothetical protein